MRLTKKTCLVVGGTTVVLSYLGFSLLICGIIILPGFLFMASVFGVGYEKSNQSVTSRASSNSRNGKPSLLRYLRNSF